MKRLVRVEPIAELRRICQVPSQNDLPAVLYGARLSIYVTRFLLRLGLGPSVATGAMLALGVIGSLCTLLGGWWIAAGLGLIAFSYVLDCVDGEMARYRGVDSYFWAGVDYVHHMLVKGLSFLCLGVGLFREHGDAWTVAAGGIGSVCWLLLLGLRDLPLTIFAKKVVLDPSRDCNPAYGSLTSTLHAHRASRAGDPPTFPWGEGFRFRPWVVRTFFTTFEIAVPILIAAALADRVLAPFALFGRPAPLAGIVLYAYAVLLALEVAERVLDFARGERIDAELAELARRAEFPAPPRDAPASPPARPPAGARSSGSLRP
ncbi:MAG TPA: CDP-alcohol phosphatidyltransferase family protein [Planctomycetota bacterium]|nr:CDP-alcohol phosphatidyltransferase family protein [Planctomycetota bacterium]